MATVIYKPSKIVAKKQSNLKEGPCPGRAEVPSSPAVCCWPGWPPRRPSPRSRIYGTSAETATGEFGLVTAVGPGYVDVDTSFGAGGAGLRYRYPASPGDTSPFSFLARVGLGVYGTAPDTARLSLTFDDAFAEWTVLPTGGFVPLWPHVADDPVGTSYINERGDSFFNAKRSPDRPSILNTVHLVLAAEGPTLGWSFPFTNRNWTWIFNDTIRSFFPVSTAAATESVTAHELAHQFDVNPGDPDGHDEEEAWTPSGHQCLMNTGRNRALGVVRMHAPATAPTQDLMCIRSHVDDLDNSSQCSFP